MGDNLDARIYRDYNEELDLKKYWHILQRRWFPALAVVSLVAGGALLFALSLPDLYRAEGKVLFKRDRTPALTGLNEDLGSVEKLTFQGDPLDTQVEIVLSSPVLQPVIELLELQNELGDRLKLQELTANLSVQPIPGTEVLRISYESPDAQQAAAIVNQVIVAYQQANIASNKEEVVLARQFIEAQLPLSEAEVRQLEEQLRQFRASYQIISLEQEASSMIDLISGLSKEINQLKSQLSGITARQNRSQQQLGMGIRASLTSARLNESKGIQTTIQELQTVQGQLAQQRARYQDNHPILQELHQREANLSALLQQRVQQVAGPAASINSAPIEIGALQGGALQQSLIADYVRLEMERVELANRIAELSKAQQHHQQRAALLPSLAKSERELERRLAAAQTTYETLLTQLQEVRTAETQAVGNVKLVSIAEPPSQPVAPSRPLIVAAGLAFGSLLGLTTAFLLDLLFPVKKLQRQLDGEKETPPLQLNAFSEDLAEVKSSNGDLTPVQPQPKI